MIRGPREASEDTGLAGAVRQPRGCLCRGQVAGLLGRGWRLQESRAAWLASEPKSESSALTGVGVTSE